MTEPLDTYAAYVARTRAEKLAATKDRQMQKVWQAHLKRQYLHYCKWHGSDNFRVRAVNSMGHGFPNAERKAARYKGLHKVRMGFIEMSHLWHPLP